MELGGLDAGGYGKKLGNVHTDALISSMQSRLEKKLVLQGTWNLKMQT